MPTGSKNLGQAAIFHKGLTPPVNKELLWKDTNFSPSKLKEWNSVTLAWEAYGSAGGSDTSYERADPTTVTVGGIPAGTVFGTGTKQADVFDKMLYVPVAPGASLQVNNPVRQFGASGNTVLTWAVSRPAGCGPITAIEVAGLSVTPTGGNQNNTRTVTTPANTDTGYTVVAHTTAAVNNLAAASASVVWRHKRFWFALPTSQNLLTMTDAQISTILNAASSYEFATDRDQPMRSFAGTPGAPVNVYFCYLDAYGSASFVVNAAGNNAWTPRTFSYTNSDGYAAPFRLYKFNDEVTGTVNVDIN